MFASPQMFKFDPTNLRDTVTGAEVATHAVVQWLWLDDGNPGQNKQLSGFGYGSDPIGGFLYRRVWL